MEFGAPEFRSLTRYLIERVEKLSIPEPNSGCWLWVGAVNKLGGYGKIMAHGKSYKAHRFSWMAHFGEIPSGLHVCHRCDNPSCVNPDHLFVGTASDNMRDMYAKGRHPKVRLNGEKHPRNKLTEDQAREIIASPKHSRGLAQKFGVSNSRISSVRKGLTWKHLHTEGI